jgi:hypothetical protein
MILVPRSLIPDLSRGRINITADTFRLQLLAATYAPDMAAHSRRDSIAAHELPTANGYTQGGAGIAITDVTDATLRRTTWTFAATTFSTTSAATARYAAVVKWRGGAASTDELIMVVDFGIAQSGPFLIPSQAMQFHYP